MERKAPILIAGHTGLVGSAVARALKAAGFERLLLPSRRELDLTVQRDVYEYFSKHRPEYVLHCAGRVGGIQANNTFRADFIRDNLLMSVNLIEGSQHAGTSKLLVLGSSCIYPRLAPQ